MFYPNGEPEVYRVNSTRISKALMCPDSNRVIQPFDITIVLSVRFVLENHTIKFNKLHPPNLIMLYER